MRAASNRPDTWLHPTDTTSNLKLPLARWGSSTHGAHGVALESVLRVADLSPDTPRRGDLLRRLSPPETWRIEEVEPDALGLSLRLTLARAP
jgi:hypothetical protein